MNHHNYLERFASRGLKAQQVVDDILAGGPPAGGTRKQLEEIRQSHDRDWLNRVRHNGDLPIGLRNEADRRLRALSTQRRKGAKTLRGI